MGLQSKNMNYIFNVEYFKDIAMLNTDAEGLQECLQETNKEIVNFAFQKEEPLAACREMEGYQEFSLYTLYPGLLVGTGNLHEIAVAGALKQGFSFDYVTGLPYVPGSSLKGMLRSYFPGEAGEAAVDEEYESMIKGLLGQEELDVQDLKEHLFDNNDIFLGAFPVPADKGESLLEMEYITSHRDRFKNPNPVSMIKVKPAVKFCFSFVFSDYEKNGVKVSAKEKADLCRELILLMGIGAKTNTGFGRFSETKPKENILVPRPEAQSKKPPKCKNPGCNNTVQENKKYGGYYTYCWECSQKNRK
ncbi:MAG: type III-B CRISPR module RAMP protein Cmr6 [Lachnospiraceae bacterium]|nr:type III-B CRISPR module RAMP protein Cmr6 [Lachnospiraceae bacterium]MBP3610165.1 type III-B CRISPR module RAMP protein Cmr6 [Lachnospiraceae bacterium]